MAGVVFFENGDDACFQSPTAIEPANAFAIPHTDLMRNSRKGELEVLGVLGEDFKAKLKLAIAACKTIEPRRKLNLLALVDGQEI